MIPFHCDGLLPIAERYASLKFRRVARRFRSRYLDKAEALELVAFLHIVPREFARFIFHWDKYGMRAARALLRHPPEKWPAYVNANEQAVDVETGVAVLRAMKDGGWTRGALPDVSKRALRQLWHEGRKPAALAEELGLSVDQVKWAIYGRPEKREGLGVLVV